jgi:hypothetical protein
VQHACVQGFMFRLRKKRIQLENVSRVNKFKDEGPAQTWMEINAALTSASM